MYLEYLSVNFTNILAFPMYAYGMAHVHASRLGLHDPIMTSYSFSTNGKVFQVLGGVA